MTTDITELAQLRAELSNPAIGSKDHLRKLALSLVEALEKAQTINAAAEKLVRCKGRYHSEQNYRALAALFGVTTPDLPPVEHENVHYADAAEMEIAALRQRIAELEESNAQIIQSRDHYKRMTEEGLKRLAESRTVTAAAADLLAERQRQISAEGWAPEHDDEHCNGELAMAAVCYINETGTVNRNGGKPWGWPWAALWWKPDTRRRNMVKAGALILAEIERLDRAAGIKVEGE